MLPVSLLDLILGGFGFDAESIVELCFCYHRRRGLSKLPGTSIVKRWEIKSIGTR